MPAKGLEPGSPGSDTYELLSREHSLEISNSNGIMNERASMEEPDQEIHHRQRRSQSHSDGQRRPDEVAGLLGGAWSVKYRIKMTGGLAIALELITQSTPSLLAAVIGSAMTGVVFDQVQFWPAFVRIGELFILVPILLNLKGCLEMNLASRLSTSVTLLSIFAHEGEYGRIRYKTNATGHCDWKSRLVASPGSLVECRLM
jgi:hypothetical protein